MLEIETRNLWLPFTQMSSLESARTFVRGEGNYLFDASGNRIFDAVSSIWTTVHGHCHPHIVRAIAAQAARLDHATLLGATHPPAEDLARRLAELVRLEHVFFSGDGASAIEAALKMALQYWQEAGQPERTRFVRLVHAYHGDTSGAMSLTGIAAFKSRFGPLAFETLPYDGDGTVLERCDVAAVVVEPIVQAAAGMRVVPPERYAPLRECAPLVIADEIATGFGRTGTMFAFEQTGLKPDIVCLGKGITGGALPLSATVASRRVFEAFLGEPNARKQFFHGHSYAGNPIACAAALANIELFKLERSLEHAAFVGSAIEPALDALARSPLVRETRRAGLMIGIELAGEAIDAGDASTPAWRVANELYGRGHFTRPIGDVIQLVPPLSCTVDEVCGFLGDLEDVLDALAWRA